MGTLDLYNVLDKLKQIENPTEDQKQAIQSTEAMTKGAVKTDASGTQTYKAYGEDSTPADLGRLAGNKPITVIKEAVELKEDEDVARDFAMNITDHILNQYDKGGLGDIVVTGTVLKGIEDTIDNADFTMMDNEKKDMAIAITKIIRDEFGTNGHSPYNIPKDADGYSFELQDVISDYIMKAGSMEEMPAESVTESDIDMFADIDKVAPKINKMKMDLVDGGMEPEDAHDEACEKYGVDPEDYDKYLEFKSSIKYPEKSIKTEGHMDFDQAYDKLGDPPDETIAYEIGKLEKYMKPEEYKKLVDYFKEKRGADVFEGRMSDAMIGAEEIVFGYFDGEGLPRMTDEEMIVDLEVRRSQAKTPQEDLELSIAIDMIEKGEHLSMNEAHCNTKRKKTEDADPVDDKDPKYADDMHLKKPMSKQEKGDQDYVDNYDRNKHIADMEDELGEVEAMIAGTKDKGEIRTYNYIAADIRDQIQRLKAGEDITDYGPEDDFIEKIKPTEGKDMKELKIMDDLQAKFESEMKEESKKETVAESTETKKETVKEDYSITMDVNETGDRSVQVSAANESADELLDLLNLSGLRSKGYTEVSEDDINEDELANSPDEKVQTDYDAQWNGAAGGNAQPNHPSAQKSSTHPLHASVEESVTEEKMTDLYKEYKGEEKAEEKKGE